MKHKILKMAVVFMCCSVAQATPTGEAPSSLKIGVIDINEVLQKSPQRDALAKELEKEFAGPKKIVMDLDKELQKLEEKAKRDKDVLSQNEQRELEQRILEKRKDLKRAEQNYQEDASIQENQKAQKLFQEIGMIIDELAKKEGYDFIIRREAAPFYISKRVDITEKVIKQLQQKK